jgi:hypothetical protein
MSRRQLPVYAWHFCLALAACLVAAGCSVFSPKPKEPKASDILTQPITRQRVERQREEDQRHANWFTSMFVPKDPPPPKSVGEWMQNTKPVRP